jgi:hypothetical protein
MSVHDYSPWPIPVVVPTEPTPACGCSDPEWLFDDNASYGCANCCREQHPNLREHSCRGRGGRWFAAFVAEHDRLEAEIAARGLDPHRLPVPEIDERVVSLRATLVNHIRKSFVRTSSGDYVSNPSERWSGCDYAKSWVGNMIVGALCDLGYPDELQRAVAVVEGRDVPDLGVDPRRALADLRRECCMCSMHYDEDRRAA